MCESKEGFYKSTVYDWLASRVFYLLRRKRIESEDLKASVFKYKLSAAF